MERIYHIIMKWIQHIRPCLNKVLENHPYIPLILIALVWLIAALIQTHKKKSKSKPKTKPKKNPAAAGGYTNFKGEVWYPDGRKWNQDTQKWETANYTEDPTEQS